MPIYKKVNKGFFKKWTPNMAYILGFFAADGYITVNKRGGQFWCLSITDKKLLKHIKEAIGADHKISIRPGNGKTRTQYRLQIGSIEMCNDLRGLGYSERKTHCLSVPTVPHKFFADFVRGYFDGDGNVWMGYIHKERRRKLLAIRIVFTSCSGDFLRSVKERLGQEGITNGVVHRGNGGYYRLTYSIRNSLKLYDFMYNGEVKNGKGIFLRRKKRIFDKFIKMRV